MQTEVRHEEPPGPSSPADSPGLHRVLLVADEVFQTGDLIHELRSHLSGNEEEVEVLVIAPALSHSALDQELGNVDQSLPEAGERMNAIVAALHEVGLKATGRIGDADPLVAIGDGLAEYAADEIVVVIHVDEDLDQAEKGLSERIMTDFHQPVTRLRVGRPEKGAALGVIDIEHAPAHERTEEEIIMATRNFPPLKKRDLVGILVGLIGTVAVGMIAVAAGIADDGELSGGAAAILLIAVATFLINVAHIVGLIFFESVRYTGIWERFMARTSILVTTVGLAAALILWLA